MFYKKYFLWIIKSISVFYKKYFLWFLKSISVFYKKYFLYAKQVVHLALPPVRLPILHLRLPSVATMERVFPRKTQKKLWDQWTRIIKPQKKETNWKSISKKKLIQSKRHNNDESLERRKTGWFKSLIPVNSYILQIWNFLNFLFGKSTWVALKGIKRICQLENKEFHSMIDIFDKCGICKNYLGSIFQEYFETFETSGVLFWETIFNRNPIFQLS